MKGVIAFLCVFACFSFVNAADVPTPADNTVSVLKKTEPAQVQSSACCEKVREVTLGPLQARRLQRQADRQEARAAKCCCDCEQNCCKKKPTALVADKNRCNCCR